MRVDTYNRITILGLGNILMGDDGFGVEFIVRFSKRYVLPDNVTVVDGGTAGLGLLDIVSSADYLIVIDAVKIDDHPGSLYRFTKQDMARYLPPPTSAHEVEFLDVLAMADLMGQCPPVLFLTVVPKKYDTMAVGISDIMMERFSDVERLLLEELDHLSIRPEKADRCTS